jgi:phosphopantothenoylcysteine decarboxylase/phosphopantothenate--cysteine ligase
LIVNDVSGGAVFGSADNEAVVLSKDSADIVEVPHGSKNALAHVIVDHIAARL